MRKKIIYFGIILFAILLQLSFLPIINGNNFSADAVLMLVLAVAVLDGFAATLSWAIVAGILYDFATYAILGQHVLVFLLIVYLVSFFSRRLSVEVKGTGLLLLFLFVIAATLISNESSAFFSVSAKGSFKFYLRALGGSGSMIFQLGCNTLLFFLWYNLVKKIKQTFL